MSRILVSKAMTSSPHGISPDETISTARARLREFRVRHLPVRTGGRVIGIITERDLDFLAKHVDLNQSKVGDVMIPDPYCVPPTAALTDAVNAMLERRIDSVLVVDGEEKLLGIFTDTDALRLLGNVLNSPKKSKSPAKKKGKSKTIRAKAKKSSRQSKKPTKAKRRR